MNEASARRGGLIFAILPCMPISPHPSRWSALLLGGAVLLGLAACGANDGNSSAATAPSTTSAVVLDKTAACAELTKDLDALKMRAINLLDALLKAESDPSLAPKATEDVRDLFAEMQAAADKHLATAGDPELKAALTAFSEQIKTRRTAIEAAGQDVEKLFDSMDDPAFEQAGDKLDQLCP